MEPLLSLLSGISLLAGSFLILSGAIGVQRFPDYYTRVHAAGVTDTLAAILIISGLLLLAGWSTVAAKLIMILVFLLFTGPTATHALTKAAFRGGLKPWQADQVSGPAGDQEGVERSAG